jgi:hypothetical protein
MNTLVSLTDEEIRRLIAATENTAGHTPRGEGRTCPLCEARKKLQAAIGERA